MRQNKLSSVRMTIGSLIIGTAPFLAFLLPDWTTSWFCQPEPWTISIGFYGVPLIYCQETWYRLALVGFAVPIIIGFIIFFWPQRKKHERK